VSDDVEVCVVGGGPAGAALAARLAQRGHDVAIVERQRFPRPHVGESLSPGIWPLLDALGVRERVTDAGFTRTATARVRWRDDREERIRAPGGLTVDRGPFDEILLHRAREAGARALAPARALRAVRRGERWELGLGDRVLRARFLADATGRRRLLGGRREPTAPRTLALQAIWRGGPPLDGSQTRIDVLAEGWLWGARLPDGTFRAMAFVDPQTLLDAGRDAARLYRRLLAASPLFAELVEGASLAGRVRACDATSYAAPTPIDETCVKVGEAAFAIDPLSSSGVQTAIQTGLAAAAAVASILAQDGDTAAALAYYTAQQRHAVERHAATAASLYAEHRPHEHAPFWRRRSAAASPAPSRVPAPGALADLLEVPVRLASGAALRDTPCLVEDRVELRRALTHPVLDRPVAFLGGDALAPLLDLLPTAASLAHAIRAWDGGLRAGRAHEIAGWLHARGLIAPASAPGSTAAPTAPDAG
jgi:flavin-dependent dehydrogenase